MEAKSANIEEIILVDTECLNLDLNHGRIKKIEGLEPLTRIERFWSILMIYIILISYLFESYSIKALLEMESHQEDRKPRHFGHSAGD